MNSSFDTVEDLQHAILAAVPLLYVVTAEEGRLLSEIERICMMRSRKLWVHAISTGIYNVHFAWMDGSWKKPRHTCVQKELRDPVALLENLRERSHDDGVFVLLDFHVAWRDAMVRRLTRDVVRHFRQAKNSLIVVAPVADLPADLATEICRFDFPLPGRAELAAKLDTVLESRSLRGMPIRLREGDAARVVETGLGLTLADFECALNWTAARGSGQTGAELLADVLGVKKQAIRRAGTMHWRECEMTMKWVGGMNVLKAWFEKRRRAFTAEAAGFGLPRPKGILLLGVPGCGKSLMAKACAALWQLPLLQLDTGSLFSSLVGSSEENCRQAIRLAEAAAPCILWIDEIEKALSGAGSSSYSDGGTAARVFATFATWLQEKRSSVFVVATANAVTSLPSELIRRGRWDEIFFIDLPGDVERGEIFRIHIERCGRDPAKFDLDRLAEACPGFSGAEIEQAVVAALFDVFDDHRDLSDEAILSQLETIIPLSKSMEEQVSALRSWALTRARLASDTRAVAVKRPRRNGSRRPALAAVPLRPACKEQGLP
jgi:hypothetical protein